MFKWFNVYFFLGLLVVFGAVALVEEEEEALTFQVDGIEHYETRTVSDNIVILTDIQDQFIITFDYGRDIFLINNLKTQTCYFSSLENIPINKDDNIPVLFVEENGKSHQNEADVVFTPGGSIPYSYIHLTNDITVAEQCISKPSYWLEIKDGARKRRAYGCGGNCPPFTLICVCIGFFC